MPPTPHAGPMRHPITLQRATKIADGFGGSTVAWETLATAWADIVPRSATERVEDERLTALFAFRARLHAIDGAGLRESDAVLWNDLRHAIITVDASSPYWVYLDLERGRAP